MKECYASYIFLFRLSVRRHRQHAWCMPAVRKLICLLHWQPILRNCKGLFCATCRLAMPHLFRTTVSYLNINDLFPLCVLYDETLPHCITIAKNVSLFPYPFYCFPYFQSALSPPAWLQKAQKRAIKKYIRLYKDKTKET